MYQRSSPSQSGKALVWALVVLAIVTIVVVLLALRRFNKDTDDMLSESSSPSDANHLQKEEGDAPSDSMADAQKSFASVGGFVGEVIDRSGDGNDGGKWIKLSVSDQTAKEEGGKVTQYLFFLSNKDTKGTADVKSGSMAMISFIGSPSEVDYVQASSVEVK